MERREFTAGPGGAATASERKLGRHLSYEEVIVLFSQDYQAPNYSNED